MCIFQLTRREDLKIAIGTVTAHRCTSPRRHRTGISVSALDQLRCASQHAALLAAIMKLQTAHLLISFNYDSDILGAVVRYDVIIYVSTG